MISQRVEPMPKPWTMVEVVGCELENLPSVIYELNWCTVGETVVTGPLLSEKRI